VAEALRVQGIDLGVLESTTPLVGDVHAPRIGHAWPPYHIRCPKPRRSTTQPTVG
jgi:hypothetical protein